MTATTAPAPATGCLPERVVLHDGTAVQLRLAVPADHGELTGFFHRLSPDSRRRRFFGAAEPSARLLDTFCTSSHPADAGTVVAIRLVNGVGRAIAVASYFRINETSAEVAFAVDDAYQGHGLGSMLLARVATLARDQGFARVDAQTLPDNGAMLHVLRTSGLEMRIKPQRGCVTVQLRLSPPPIGPSTSTTRPTRSQ